jgi:hypothetical protein
VADAPSGLSLTPPRETKKRKLPIHFHEVVKLIMHLNYWVGAYIRAVFVLDDFFPTRIVCWLYVIHHFIAFVFLWQTFLEFSDVN